VFDPAMVRGSDDVCAKAFIEVAVLLRRRIQLMLALPVENLDAPSMRRNLRDIGRES
jgi:arsenate reductase